jgi:ketosteroid isomerase-like protein
MTDSLEDRIRRIEDLLEIQQLFIDYGEHLDSGDFDAYARLFAEDGEVLLGPMGRATGRPASKRLMVDTLGDKVGSTYHIVSSPRVCLDGDTATSTVMWSVAMLADDGLARLSMVGHHLDTLTRTADGWRIQRRKGMVDLPALMPGR